MKKIRELYKPYIYVNQEYVRLIKEGRKDEAYPLYMANETQMEAFQDEVRGLFNHNVKY